MRVALAIWMDRRKLRLKKGSFIFTLGCILSPFSEPALISQDSSYVVKCIIFLLTTSVVATVTFLHGHWSTLWYNWQKHSQAVTLSHSAWHTDTFWMTLPHSPLSVNTLCQESVSRVLVECGPPSPPEILLKLWRKPHLGRRWRHSNTLFAEAHFYRI